MNLVTRVYIQRYFTQYTAPGLTAILVNLAIVGSRMAPPGELRNNLRTHSTNSHSSSGYAD